MAYFYIEKDAGTAMNKLAVVSMILYIASFSVGMGGIPWLLMSEIFPAHVRGKAGSLATAVNFTCAFILVESFEKLNVCLKPQGTFMLFAAMLLSSSLFILKFVPETKGKTLEQIQMEFLDK